MKLLIMIICFPTNISFINYISYTLIGVSVIFSYIIQWGQSFLHICAFNGQTDVCGFLILKGANINQEDKVSIVFHYSCVTTDNIYRIYPFWQKCKTCYIMWERTGLEWNWGNQEASWNLCYFMRYITGLISLSGDRYITYTIFILICSNL